MHTILLKDFIKSEQKMRAYIRPIVFESNHSPAAFSLHSRKSGENTIFKALHIYLQKINLGYPLDLTCPP